MPLRFRDSALPAAALAAGLVLWIFYFTHERDVYKVFALLGLSTALAGLCLWQKRRPVAVGFLVAAIFLHGFANFAPEIFGQTEEAVAACAPCAAGGDSEGEEEADDGPMYPDA